ncbi:MAG: ATP-binding protein [Campylobacterota bacterium]|nr:ATP-binding protein [Campylobacterota bacterium]
MKYLIEFIDSQDVAQTEIFSTLKCSENEAKILQYVASKYITGQDEIVVSEILTELFGSENYKFIEYLGDVKELLELGWILHNSFTPIKVNELSHLELLNSSVSPTPSLLRLLEDGSLEVELPDIKPYADHLEYLQDQFFRIELYQKISSIRNNVHENALGIDRAHSKLQALEARINERVEQTNQEIVLDKFFKQKKLDNQEQIIFIALLKEEYSAGDGSLREMNALIELISLDEYDKIKNRSILEDGARLITDDIIDYEEMLSPFGGITRAFYINEELLQSIMHPQKKKKVQKVKLDMLIKEQDIFELVDPKTSLEDVVLNEQTEKTLRDLMRQMDKEVVARLVKWGIKDKKSGLDARIIFYGAAGTGKTMTSYSLAKSLKRQVLSFDCSKILSMYVGESEKNVRKIFDTYKDLALKTKSEPLLLLNEADQFLSSRSSGNTSGAEQMHNQMQNIFLEQIEKFEGLLIATTNLLENIDVAFSRRFNYKIEFKKPNEDQRRKLWELMLPKDAEFEDGFSLDALVPINLTGGQINLIVKNTSYKVAAREVAIFAVDDFLSEIKKEKKGNFDSDIQMGFLQD